VGHWVPKTCLGYRLTSNRNGGKHLCHIALNLLGRETVAKRGLKAKRKKAAWDEQYLLKVLTDE
jgi:hypothetical protein